MWILECNNNHGQQKSTDDPLHGPKPRTLTPRPFSSTFSIAPTPCLYPPWNQTLSGCGGRREMISAVPLASTRWNPTPEQLQALEEMYRSGINTPSSQQIQQIAAKLRKFGKIEGKNVFYWFQNHKARERQKKRRQLELTAGKVTRGFERQPEKRQSGLGRTNLETKHPKKLPTITSNCSTASEYCASMQGEVVQECKQNKWTQLNCKELHQQNLTAKSTETCWTMQLSSPSMPLNNKATEQKATAQENEKPLLDGYNKLLMASKKDDFSRTLESGIEENHRTLQLFPVESDDSLSIVGTKAEEENHDVSRIGKESTRNYQYFEFLPTKN